MTMKVIWCYLYTQDEIDIDTCTCAATATVLYNKQGKRQEAILSHINALARVYERQDEVMMNALTGN